MLRYLFAALAAVVLVCLGCGPVPASDERPGDEGVALWTDWWDPDAVTIPERELCSDEKLAQVREPSTDPITIDCHLALEPNDVITRPLRLVGERSSGVRVRCHGATLTGPVDTIRIRSEYSDGEWEPVHDVTIDGCTIQHGSVRIWGAVMNGGGAGELEELEDSFRESSRTLEHVLHTRQAAPYHITLRNLDVIGQGRIPLYLAPGTHHVDVIGTTLRGESESVMLYLDAETTAILVEDSDIRAEFRRAVAVDGSSHNVFRNNRISSVAAGVELYRNCGERRNSRHATSSHNRFESNRITALGPCLWFGSRGGRRGYCGDDEPGDYGSAVSDFDHVRHTRGSGNRFRGCAVWHGDSTNFDNRI